MKEQLCSIITNETETLQELLNVLEDQYSYVIKNDVFGMESCVDKIQNHSKNIASCEVKRRNITKGRAMREIIEELKDEELEVLYRNIKKLLEDVKLQKDTNELLIKQGLGYTNKMLHILSPDRNAKTYNSYGKVHR